MKKRFYLVIRTIARVLFAILYPTTVIGAENIPASGGVILCGNHISMIDPIVAACSIVRPVRFMAKKELFAFKPLGGFFQALGAFSVDRGGTDMAAMRTSLSILKNGEVLGIFPQGTRDKDHEHGKMESGVGLIALRSRAIVIPMRVFGPYRLFRRTRLVIGPPVDLSGFDGVCDSHSIDAATRRIERDVWALGAQ